VRGAAVAAEATEGGGHDAGWGGVDGGGGEDEKGGNGCGCEATNDADGDDGDSDASDTEGGNAKGAATALRAGRQSDVGGLSMDQLQALLSE